MQIQNAAPGGDSTTSFGQRVAAIRPDMLRFASLQLRDVAAAEDLVQEAIETALAHAESYRGEASVKTWMFSILRNKLIDYVRMRGRSVSISAVVDSEDDSEDKWDTLFNDQGFWKPAARPARWPGPEDAMVSKQFWLVVEACLTRLPEQTARVFVMREVLGLDTDEICKIVEISTSNFHVLMHRARMRLRQCLEEGWGRG